MFRTTKMAVLAATSTPQVGVRAAVSWGIYLASLSDLMFSQVSALLRR
jgi:hypothetical protein